MLYETRNQNQRRPIPVFLILLIPSANLTELTDDTDIGQCTCFSLLTPSISLYHKTFCVNVNIQYITLSTSGAWYYLKFVDNCQCH